MELLVFRWLTGQPHKCVAALGPITGLRFHHRPKQIFDFLDSPWNSIPSLQIAATLPKLHPSFILHSIAQNMCPPSENTTNGASNGANGTNGNGANHDGFTSVQSSHNPHPSHKSPYQPVGDFLSNVSRFKIIGMLYLNSTPLLARLTLRGGSCGRGG